MLKRTACTIQDVAQEAKVSVATVSAVLNEGISTKPVARPTRLRVLRAIKRLDYRVNEQARALRRGRTAIIGLMLSDVTQPFTGHALRAVEDELRKRKYHYLLADANNSPEREAEYLKVFLQKQVEGVIYVGTSITPDGAGLSELVNGGVPVVLTEREAHELRVPTVLVNNYRGVMSSTLHLVRLGRRNIAHLGGPATMPLSAERQRGYLAALESAGLTARPEWIVEAGLTLQAGYEAMKRLYASTQRPDAIVAFNDAIALGAMRAIREAGGRIPQDVAVVGFDDIPIAAFAEPPLTTVRQPVNAMYHQAVCMLLDVLEGKLPREYAASTVLEPELVVRQSCGSV